MTLHDPFQLLYDKYQSQYRQLCIPARTLAEIGNELLGQVAEFTTPEQIEQLQQSLEHLYKELEKMTGLSHYGASFGPPHACVKDIYIHASALLKNRAILQQPPPSEEPEDPQPPLTHEDVENIFHSLPPETYFGKEQDEDDSQ